MELRALDLDQARQYATEALRKARLDIRRELPNFDQNFNLAQSIVGVGSMSRREMPVIDTADVKDLQARLESGFIDLTAPWSKVTQAHGDPFPQGLSGKQAQQWLEGGLRKYDGSRGDDKVQASLQEEQVGNLVPIQGQIYFDKAVGFIVSNGGAAGAKLALASNILIASSDLHLIDGHHRFLAGLLISPATEVPVLAIDLSIKQLLPLTLSYSDVLGHPRNQ